MGCEKEGFKRLGIANPLKSEDNGIGALFK